MFKDSLFVTVKGHVKITDDLGNVLLDKDNAIHPQNVARVFARALANENNYIVNDLAYLYGALDKVFWNSMYLILYYIIN